MYYDEKQRSLVNIAEALNKTGWKIFGFHEDESDSMTDYYCPADWQGIATKNDCVFCANIGEYESSYSGKTIYSQETSVTTYSDNKRIHQLELLSIDKGAPEGEKKAALAAIERIKARQVEQGIKLEKSKKVVCQYPVFQMNPPHSNWHVEKDGKIIAKGNGAFQFGNFLFEYDYDVVTGEFKERWGKKQIRQLSENEKKSIDKFEKFLDRVNSAASIKVGNGSDNEYEIVDKTEYKTEIHSRETILNDFDSELKSGMYFQLKVGFNYGCYKGKIYQITDLGNGMMYALAMNRKLTKVCAGYGNTSNHFTCTIEKFKQWIISDSIVLVELYEEKVPYTVQKCVKKQVTEDHSQVTELNDSIKKISCSIREDVDTRDNSKIFLVKLLDSLSRSEYINVNRLIKKCGGYYSRFKHAFLFKDDPTNGLKTILNVA